MVEIRDNFLDEVLFEKIESEIMGPNFPWYINDFVVDKEDHPELNNLQSFQLVHNVYQYGKPLSGAFDLLSPLLDKLEYYSLLRVKANCNLYTETNFEHGMHTDVKDLPDHMTSKTAVFYFNTNDGYTKIESTGEKIESVANRVVIFDSRERHTGSTPTNVKKRMVLNINYIPY